MLAIQIKSVNGVSISITDLQLAAELGKALLERNRELEAQIIHLQQINNEQNLEIEVQLYCLLDFGLNNMYPVVC